MTQTLRTLLPLTFLALLMTAAPMAAAQEDPEPPQDGGDAWVKDCPPDMMCAYGGGEAPACDAGNETCDDGRVYKGDDPGDDQPTYDGDCGGEVCAYGDEDCIECSGPVDEGGSTCMDGQQGEEVCRDDVQYFGGEPTRGPADGSCENCRGDTAAEEGAPTDAGPISSHAGAVDEGQNQVPGAALVGTLAALGIAGLALRRRQ